VVTYHDFLNILKKAKVSQHDFFRVHGRSAASAKVIWGGKGVVPPWVEKHATALLEVPGYRDYIMDQDMESLKGKPKNGGQNPFWLHRKKHNGDPVGGRIDLVGPDDGSGES
jgi:hypothetical protein